MEISIKYINWTTLSVESIEYENKLTTIIKLKEVIFYYIVCKVMRKIVSNCKWNKKSKHKV